MTAETPPGISQQLRGFADTPSCNWRMAAAGSDTEEVLMVWFASDMGASFDVTN